MGLHQDRKEDGRVCSCHGGFFASSCTVKPAHRFRRNGIGADSDDHPDAIVAGANLEPLKALAHERLLRAGLSDPIDNRVRLTVMERAIRKAQSGRRA